VPQSDADTFVGQIQTKLDALTREFLDLELEQMRKGEVTARQKIEKAKRSIAQRRKELEQRVERAREAAPAAWDDVKDGVESAWTELCEAVNHARADFEGTLEEEEEEPRV
jgi:signal transduction histidine kinase